MREFKFRAFDTKEKKWLYAYEEIGGFDIKGELILLGEYGSGLPLERFLNDVEITQYTGLKDKNGKEIYEGDILRVKAPYEGDDDARNIDVRWFGEGGFIIEWSCGFNGGDSDLTLLGWAKIEDYQFEVIGNIYQNPELLKP